MKISIVTASIRDDMLPIVQKCLKRQDFTEYEWIITSPVEITSVKPDLLLKDPPKLDGDFYTLCKGWNQAFAHAKGELTVSVTDGIWFPPDTLSKLWFHYQNKPRSLVSAIGHQYDQLDDRGEPINKMWHDPRSNTGVTFQEVPPSEMELVICSIPKQALIECGGFDEEYDTCAAVGEKEMCWRLNKLGWDFYIDQTLEYKAIHHPRLSDDWDKVYKEKSTPLFIRHMAEISMGTRTLNVDSLLKYRV